MMGEKNKRDVAVLYYNIMQEQGHEAAEAWLGGVSLGLQVAGMTQADADGFERDVFDLLDAYIEGEWEDE